MINLLQLFNDTSVTISDNGGTVAPTIHLGGPEGCIHVLVEDWEKLHGTVMALIDGAQAQQETAPETPADTTPADAAPADADPAATK